MYRHWPIYHNSLTFPNQHHTRRPIAIIGRHMPEHSEIIKITGPPGCGKTTEVLRLIKEALQRFFPSQIGAVSFTNAAVETVKDRIENAGVDRKMVKNIRTMHSHCFKLLGLNTKNIAEYKLSEFNKLHPAMSVDSGKQDDASAQAYRKEATGTYMYNQMNLLRNHRTPREEWSKEIKVFARAWFDWMEESDIWDFTRMLEATIKRGLAPEKIEVLFVDESQDLTPLQMEVINTWAKNVSITYFAGDSDQCIFRFSGAVPEAFMDLKYTSLTHLDQSYRVPPAVHNYAEKIVKQIKNRENTSYKPDERRGPGRLLTSKEPDLGIEGSHMILCRCNYQVTRWINWLLQKKTLWSNPYRVEDLGWNPQLTKSWQAIKIYQEFLAGAMITVQQLHTMISCVIAKDNIRRGFKNYALNYTNDDGIVDLFDAQLFGITDRFMDTSVSISKKFRLTGRSKSLLLYMLDIEKSLADTPRVIVGTVHSVKGGEADNVWIDPSIPGIIWNEMRRSQTALYDECRVAYVAATRARQTLGVLASRSPSPVYPKI